MMRGRLPVLVPALWWGSLSTTGFLVVPLLFAHLPSAAMAGSMAAKLFTAQTWVSVVCGMLLLVFRPNRDVAIDGKAQIAIFLVVAGLLLALLGEFAVAPHIVARDNLKLWHSIGSAMYLLQWLCAGMLLWRAAAQPR